MVAAVLAEPMAFRPLRETEDCVYSATAPDERGYPVLKAECRWPDVTLGQVDAVLRPWDHHQEVWSMVARSELLEEDAEGAAVRHLHTAPLMADREAVLWMWVESEEQGFSYRWMLADEQPPVAEGNEPILRDDGRYTVLRDGDGVHVVATLHYDPGGSIPPFLVRWFQQLGLPRFLEELKRAALGEG